MKEKDIIKIELIKDARIENTHNGFLFPKQYIIKVYYRNNEVSIIDLFSKIDITNIDYFKIHDGRKVKVLFEENNRY